MEYDRIKWNEKHATKKGFHRPDSFLQKHFFMLKKGKALDIACGLGRNAFLLAENGFETIAVDYSDIGLMMLKKQAENSNLFIKNIVIDLDQPDLLLSEAPFDTIICVNFKPKPDLLKIIPQLLTNNGTFLLSSFNEIQSGLTPFPAEKALQQDEFLNYWPALKTIIYERFSDETGERDAYLFCKD